MGCEHVNFPDGTAAIICTRGRRQTCTVCGRPSVALCDYPVTKKGRPATCDSPMCQQHRHPVPGQTDVDYCQGHHDYEQRERDRERCTAVEDANREMGLPEDGDYGDQ